MSGAGARGSLTRRFAVALCLMLVPLAGAVTVALVGLEAVNRDTERVIDDGVSHVLPIVDLRVQLGGVAVAGSRAAVGLGPWSEYELRLEESEAAFEDLLAPPGHPASEAVAAAHESWHDAQDALAAVRSSGAVTDLLADFSVASNDAVRQLGEAEAITLRRLDVASQDARRAEHRLRYIFLALGVTAVAGALVATAWLGRTVLRPLHVIHAGLRQLAAGDLSFRIGMRRPDEIGDVARAVDALTERLEDAHAELAHRSLHDALTGLPNRTLFDDRLALALRRATRSGTRLAVLMVDLDGFKDVNDTFGHQAGDAVLVEAAQRLVGALRDVDTAARLGGDEFAVLIEGGETADDVFVVATRIVEAFRAPFTVAATDVVLGASAGVVVADGTQTAEELLRDADLAMYAAKEHGRNRAVLFEPRMHDAVVERMTLTSDLRRALDAEEFFLAYQPIVEIASGRVHGFEALLRWQHPARGVLAAHEFVPLADEAGLTRRLGAWVLGEVCRQLQQWRRELPDCAGLWVSMNVSLRQLRHGDIEDDVAHAVDVSGLPPSNLVFEVVESAVFEAGDLARVEALRATGVRIAVEKFGMGSSSLGQLRSLPVDMLKLAREFLPAGDEPESTSLLSAMLEVARALNVTTIAEGVESQYQANLLQMLGCKLAQGYRIGRPQDGPATTAWLRSRRGHAAADDATNGTPRRDDSDARAFAVLARTGRVRHASQGIAALLGYSPEEKLGTNFLDIVHPDDRSRAVEEFLTAVAAPGEHGPLPFRVLRGDGTWGVYDVVTDSRVDDPEVGGVVITLHERTSAVPRT